MNCKEAEIQIMLQESGELNARRQKALAAHLHDCEACRRLQQAAVEAERAYAPLAEPSAKALQAVLREARLQAPENKPFYVFGLKPAMAMTACAVLVAGLFWASFDRNRVGLELVMEESQLLEPADQVVSVMYSGLSEDDLAFNFLMTYDGG